MYNVPINNTAKKSEEKRDGESLKSRFLFEKCFLITKFEKKKNLQITIT